MRAMSLLLFGIACEGGGVDPALELEGDPAAGASHYQDLCATCHGGEGEGGVGPALAGYTGGREEVIDLVRSGDGGMPSFDGQLDDQGIADVAAFVVEDLAAR